MVCPTTIPSVPFLQMCAAAGAGSSTGGAAGASGTATAGGANSTGGRTQQQGGGAGTGGATGTGGAGTTCPGSNKSIDPANCGACNYACVDGRTCSAGRCTPAWIPLSSTNAPAPRTRHAAGFVAGRFIVLGGALSSTGVGLSSSAAYDPTTDTWQPLPDLQSPRCAHEAASTGSKLFAFGGLSTCANGSAVGPALEEFTPESGWFTVAGSNPPALRYNFASTWTGSDMFIYGGGSSAGPALSSGALFSPPGMSWRDASCTLAGCERGGTFSAFIDGGIVRIWGGGPFGNAPAGLQYALGSGVWSAWTVPAGTATKVSQRHADAGARLYYLHSTGVSIYNKASASWLADDDAAMPVGLCEEAAAAWSGTEVIAWSGSCSGMTSSVGGRYQPVAP